MWAFNYSAVFLDTGQVLKFIENPGWTVYATLVLRGLVLIPAVLATVYLMRRPKERTGLFLLPLILVPFLGLAIPDLNEILISDRSGRLFPAVLRLLWAVRRRKIRRMRSVLRWRTG